MGKAHSRPFALFISVFLFAGQVSLANVLQVYIVHTNGSYSKPDLSGNLTPELADHLLVDKPEPVIDTTTNHNQHNSIFASTAREYSPHLSALRLYGHRNERDLQSVDKNSNNINDNGSTRREQVRLSEMTMNKFRPSWYSANRYKDLSNSSSMLNTLMANDYVQQKAFDSPILLRTRLGVLEGVRSIRLGQKRLYTFLSIPYAKPPIGELRFAAPQPIEPWGNKILQSTKWPPFCVQTSMSLNSRHSPVHVISTHMNEDCLYLNVWTPTLKYRKGQGLPVMVFIHGGAFQFGGSSVDENDGSTLATIGNVVVVTFNYRLNVFGFFNPNSRFAPNNAGLMDQRMALQWVRNNIRWFGGDPEQVTLFGESAGGHSVGLHLVSPLSYPLFKRAIMQSGVPTSFLRSYDTRSDDSPAVSLTRQLGCLGNSSIKFDTASSVTSDQQVNQNLTNGLPGSQSDDRLARSFKSTRVRRATETSTEENADNEEYEPESTFEFTETILQCLRSRSSLEILKAVGVPGATGFFPTGKDTSFFPNGPIMESLSSENLQVGPQKDILFGTNPDEGTFLMHYALPSLFPSDAEPLVKTIDELKEAVGFEVERPEGRTKVENATQKPASAADASANSHLFRPLLRTGTSMLENFISKSTGGNTNRNDSDNDWNNVPLGEGALFGRAMGSFITDIIFLCPARSMATALSEAGRNVYFYLFNHRSSQSQWHPWLGITHHDEVEFVFGRPIRSADIYSGKDIEMSRRLIKTWTHFARTGQMLPQHNVTWPRYGPEDNYYLEIKANSAKIGSRMHDKLCNVYNSLIAVHLQEN